MTKTILRLGAAALLLAIISRGASAVEPNYKLFFGDKLKKTEGIAMCPDGKMFISENESGKVWRIVDENKIELYVEGLANPAGLACGQDNTLYIDEFKSGTVTRVRVGKDGKKKVDKMAKGLKSPNGVVALKDGSILVSESDAARVTRIAPDGATSTVSDGIPYANGMALNDDESVVYVASTTSGRIYEVQLTGEDKGKKEVFFKGAQMVDGLTRDGAGNLYACLYATGRILRIDRDGTSSIIATGLKSPASPWYFRGVLFVTSLQGTGAYKVMTPM